MMQNIRLMFKMYYLLCSIYSILSVLTILSFLRVSLVSVELLVMLYFVKSNLISYMKRILKRAKKKIIQAKNG